MRCEEMSWVITNGSSGYKHVIFVKIVSLRAEDSTKEIVQVWGFSFLFISLKGPQKWGDIATQIDAKKDTKIIRKRPYRI